MEKRLIENSFSTAAQTYDSVATIQNLSSHELVKLIDFEDISTVIDIGCGTGNTSLEVYKKLPSADFTLCDISQKMLDVASQKFPKKTQKICCDAEQFQFEKNYDLAISNLCMQWFENPPKFIKKMKNHCETFAFSTLLNTSFERYKNCFDCPPTFDYPSEKNLLNAIGKVKKHETIRYTLEFENFFAIARYFKKLGAYLKSNNRKHFVQIEGPIFLDYDVFFALV